MTRDETAKLAREAGFRAGHFTLSSGEELPFVEPVSATNCLPELERFAALVAAAEREDCAELMERQHAWITNTAAANAIRARSRA